LLLYSITLLNTPRRSLHEKSEDNRFQFYLPYALSYGTGYSKTFLSKGKKLTTFIKHPDFRALIILEEN